MDRYGAESDIRVITFYNMQRRDLEREFKAHGGLSHIRIASVSVRLTLLFYLNSIPRFSIKLHSINNRIW